MKPFQRDTLPALIPFIPHLLLLAGAFLLYAQSFGHQWTMDDHLVVARNTDIRSLQGFLENAYPGRPLREITYMLDYRLFGSEPAGYHLQNVFWHGLNACLLVVLATRLGATRTVAWLSGALFLVHPLNVEVVANISHRKESLMLAFSLLALLAFLRASRGRFPWLWGGAGVALLGIGYLAKETAVGVLVAAAGCALARAESLKSIVRRHPGGFKGLSAGVAIGAVGGLSAVWQSAAFRASMEGCLARMNILSAASGELYLQVVLKSFAFMFLRLVWPADLAMEYVFPPPAGWSDPWVLAGLALLSALAGLAWLLRRQLLPLAGILMMIGFWLPVSNLFWPLAYFAADRYLYAVCAGFALLAGWVAARFLAGREKLLIAVCLPLLLLLSVATWKQDQVWSSELTLYQQAVRVSPHSTYALMGLGLAQMNAGNLEAARAPLEQAVANFNDSKALYLLARWYERQGNSRMAVDYFRKFVLMNEPKYFREVMNTRRYLQVRYGLSL